jgi:hypothetical protein
MRRAATAVFIAGAALAAADPAPPPPAAADPVKAAKQGLEDIHASALSPDGAAALPGLSLPEVAPLPSAPAPESPLPPESGLGPDGLKKKAGTGNWLVDAMEKADRDAKADKAPGRAQDRDEQLKADLELLRGEEKDPAHPEREAAALDLTAKAKPEADELKAPAYNPLDAFMAGWISARDHDLLVPAKVDPGDPAHADGLDLGPADALRAGPEASALNELRAAPNPYLAELERSPPSAASSLAAPLLPALVPPDLLEPAVAPLSAGADARPADNARSVVPDFAQPSGDDKYFPQLKRF